MELMELAACVCFATVQKLLVSNSIGKDFSSVQFRINFNY